MEWFFGVLKAYPYILLFFTVGLAVAVGRVAIKGYGLGMVAGARSHSRVRVVKRPRRSKARCHG